MTKKTIKLFGGILLVTGTSIGGGLLALPVVTAADGFYVTTLCLIVIWLLMTVGAVYILELSMALPVGTNLISMAKQTLGKPGALVMWSGYLCLTYCLLSAYTAGAADIVVALLNSVSIKLNSMIATLVIIMMISLIILRGIGFVDQINRAIMLTKLIFLSLIIFILSPHVNLISLSLHHQFSLIVLPIIATAYGYGIIIPSLVDYFERDVSQLKLVLLVGSLLPLLFYVAWELVIVGVLPPDGIYSLIYIAKADHSTKLLISALHHIDSSILLKIIISLFTTICVFTSFLAVALSLYDFLFDGLNLQRETYQHRIIVHVLAFLPPLVLTLTAPNLFIKGLNYAGIFCVIILVLLPVLMKKSAKKTILVFSEDIVPFLNRNNSINLMLIAAIVMLAITVRYAFN